MIPRTLCRPSFLARRLQPIRPRNLSTSPVLKEIRYSRFQKPTPPGSRGQRGPRGRDAFLELSPALKFAIIVGVFGGIYYATHLEQVPDTGRWRFMNASAKEEAKLGELIRQEIEQSMGNRILPPNHPVTRHVRRVASRILTASNLGTLRGERQPEDVNLFGLGNIFGGFGGFSTPDSDFGAATQPNELYGPQKEWEVIVVNDKKVVNAMAAPGVIVVFTGILPVCKDEEGLAAILGHEIGHVVARHTAERLSSETLLLGGIILLQLLGLDSFISNGLGTLFFELPNSRTQEREADLIGLRLMSRACYNPGAAPAMFNRLGKLEPGGGGGPDFIRTHPTSESRARILEQHLPDAYRTLEDNPECAQIRRRLDAFRETAKGIRIDEMGGVQLV